MRDTSLRGQRLVALFLLGCVLFCYPFISLFDIKRMVFGFPLLYFYMYAVWIGMVALIYAITRLPSDTRPSEPDSRPEQSQP